MVDKKPRVSELCRELLREKPINPPTISNGMSYSSGRIDDYLSSNGLMEITFHQADQAWGYRENEPVFAFINDPGDGSKNFQNAVNLYWASAEYISKPWCFYMVTQSKMIPHQKQILENLGSQYRIIQLEAPFELELLDSVKSQLTQLVSIMDRFIDPQKSNPYRSLSCSIKEWKIKKPIFEDVIKVNMIMGDLSQYEVNGELIPSRSTVPLTVQSGENIIEGILPRLVQKDPIIFYTEHRNLPVVFKLDLGVNTFTTRFEADKGNLIEATNYESLITAFKSSGEVSFIDQNTGNTVFDLSVKECE